MGGAQEGHGHGHSHGESGHGSGSHGHGADSHGHGHEKFKIPDWRQYKVDGIKDLEWTRSQLAAKGLRDPWLRNEVWRYKYWPGFAKMGAITLFRGFKYAAAAMVLTIAVDQVLGISKSKQHHGTAAHDEHH